MSLGFVAINDKLCSSGSIYSNTASLILEPVNKLSQLISSLFNLSIINFIEEN
jgi:hypothetical protein